MGVTGLGAAILTPGTWFGRYYVIAPLGEGGMSEVFLGYDVREPRFVALKLPRERFRSDPGALGRLRREGEIYQKLQHDSIVRLLDGGPLQDGGYFLAQEFLRGQSLTERLDQVGGPMELPEVMPIFEDLASALNCAHRNGIIHRDVQPENVMVQPDGRGKLYDFGIAFASDGHVRTAVGTVMGTLIYSAPEQRRGEPVDHRTDIFGLGAIFYEMLTGRKAIQARTFDEAIAATTDDLPLPSRRNPKVPPLIDELCRRLLRDDPGERYQDLRQMLVDLGKLRLEGDEAVKLAVFGSSEMRALDEALRALRGGDTKSAARIAAELAAQAGKEPSAEVLYLQAMLLDASGRSDLAVRQLEKALYYAPENLDVALDYAMVSLRQKDYDRALRVLDSVQGVARGSLLVLGLMDAVQAIPSAPAEALVDPPGSAGRSGILGSIRSFFGRKGG